MLINTLPNDVMKYVLICTTAKAIWTDLILAFEGPSDIRDNKITALRLKFNAFKALEGEKVNATFTRLKCLLNDLKNNGVTIPQAEVNATFVNSLPRKWLSMNQTQRANNSIKNDALTALYGKYSYEEGLIDQIYEFETSRFIIQASSSKALIYNPTMQDSESDVKEDQRSSSEFLADLNTEFQERALLANQRRFYKRFRRVGSLKKPIYRSNETCFVCEKLGHFQKDCPSIKTSTPSFPLSYKPYNKSKFPSNLTPMHNKSVNNNQKDYRVKYKGLKAELVVLNKKIDAMNKGKNEKGLVADKGLVAESFDWDEESVSSDDERVTTFKAFMAIADEELLVGRADASDERKHVLDYTHVDLHFVEDQRKNLVIGKWTSSRVTLDQLLFEQVPGNIVRVLGGQGKKKEKISSKEIIFTMSDVSSSETIPEVTFDSISEYDL
ncbi:retrovirus-related pol polyprotein from transposon TNT 1-94 [Tanacetum coccineum]